MRNVTSLNIVNLSSPILSLDEVQVLHKGLSFCPNENLDKFEFVKDLQLFARKFILRNMYQKPGGQIDLTPRENQALDQLIYLLEESDTADLIDRIDLPKVISLSEEANAGSVQDPTIVSKLKKKSDKFAAPSSNPNI